MGQPVEAIVHNSPALDSLKHQQLRSLCARHGLKSTGKKDHLIKRLKALRDRPLQDGAQDIPTSEDATTPLDGSFDILDDEEAEEAQQFGSLPGSFESDRNTAASFAMHSRVSTDEFGALSADSHTVTRSSSWKEKLASVFGGSGLAPSSSSGSLSSNRTATAGSSRASDELPIQANHQLCNRLDERATTSQHTFQTTNVAQASTITMAETAQNLRPPPTPAFRIVEDSFIQANSTYPDCSFVPRSSFEGNSADLTNVPVWPPPPGVILISPRQSPSKTACTQHAISSNIPMSAQKKRYLQDVEEDDNDDIYNDDGQEYEQGRYGSIRMISKQPLDSVITMTPGRKIAALPKKMSIIASSPPRFDLEAPPLPSFATVANQVLQQQQQRSDQRMKEEEDDQGDATVIMDEEYQDNTKPSSDTLGSLHHEESQQKQPFVFGSPRQIPLTDDSFLKRIDGFAIAKQLEELQRRTGNVVSSSSNKGLSVGDDGKLLLSNKGFIPRTASNGNLQSKNGIRFEGKHEKDFKMMDSIANHYAARRKVSNNDIKASHQLPNKRTRIESSDGVSTSVLNGANKPVSNSVHRQASCPALSLRQASSISSLGLNQQGRYAPVIPPRPKTVKSAAQQAEDRERIRKMQNASNSNVSAPQRRAGRASVSPRKAAINPSTRKLPPLSTATSHTNSIASNASSNGTTAASKLFKSTFSSLKSFGSSSSLSSKATLGGMTSSTSSKSISSQAQPVSDFGTLNERIPPSASGSITRPTIASLARQQSRQNLDSLASPRQALSPRSVAASEKTNITSPRSGTYSTLEKKKVSSISAAHRNSPMKTNLDDSIAQARRIRAKKLGSQIQSHQSSESNTAPSISRSPSKNFGLSSSATTAGSINSRPAWR